MTLTLLKNKYKHDSEVKKMQIDTLNEELTIEKELNSRYKLKLDEIEDNYHKCK